MDWHGLRFGQDEKALERRKAQALTASFKKRKCQSDIPLERRESAEKERRVNMKYWSDPSQPVQAFVRLFEKASEDEDLKTSMQKVDQLIWFDYTQDGPDCSFHVDSRGGKSLVGPGRPGEEPDLTMSLSADDAHLSWSNKLNPVTAIATRRIKVKGSPTALLKLAPKLKKVSQVYADVLKELGWEDKILR